MANALCKDIYELFTLRIKANNRRLFDKVFELSNYFVRNPVTIESLECIIELERKMMNSSGPHKQFVEEHVFQALTRSTLYCSPEQSNDEYLSFKEKPIGDTNNIDKKQEVILASKLLSFVIEVFKFNKARDNFSSKRKALSFGIIGNISYYYDIPEVFDLCLLSLKSKKKSLIFAALEFQENYTRNREVSLSPSVIEILDKIILQTKDHSVAVGVLDLQVKTGNIDEFEALSMIDEWKEKNEYW